MSFTGAGVEQVKQLLGDDIEEWQCPKCGQYAYTLKSQEALMVKCSGDHGNSLWLMTPTAKVEGAHHDNGECRES